MIYLNSKVELIVGIIGNKYYDYNQVKDIPKSYVPSPRGTKESITAPKDMKDGGAYPN